MKDDLIAIWKSKIKWDSENNHLKYVNRIDGMPTEFGRKIFTGITTLVFFEKIQSPMRELHSELELFSDRIISMSMYNDIAWQEKESRKDLNTIHKQVRNVLEHFLRGH